jgi:hypothetical protein
MADLTEKDLEQKREKNAKLRERIAEAEAKAAAQVQQTSLQIEAASLDAETARLEAQLAAAKEAAKVSNARSGAEGPLAAVTAQLEAAQAEVTPPGVAVDTNAGNESNDSSDENGGNS